MASIIIRKNEIDLAVNSKVKEVTVYSDRALVTRSRNVQCRTGENRIYFMNLGVNIDEQSIKASIANVRAHINSTSIEKNHLFFFRQEEDEKTYARILEVLATMCSRADDKSVFALENRMLFDLHEYIKNLLNALILAQENSIPKFKEALDFCESLLDKNTNLLVDNNNELENLSEEFGLLKEKLERIRSLDSKEQNNILIVVNADEALDADIEVTYAIAGASWKTSYDSKADTDAKTVELSLYGEIIQTTGEYWEKAMIVLSTSTSESDVAIPSIYPVYVGGYAEKRKKDLVIEETAIKTLADDVVAVERDEESPTDAPSGGEPEAVPAEEGRIRLEKKGVSYTFTILEPLDIPPDGRWHKGLIVRQALPAELFFETVPQLREYVYLRANVKNTLSLPMLPGVILVYRNGSYMGKSSIGYVAPDEPFCLSFGIDEDLRVKRIEYRNISTPARGLSTRNAREWEYRYILYNYKKNIERVKLREGIYVSSIKEIDVQIAGDSTQGYSMDAEGIVSWDIDLPHDPFEHTKLVLHYTLSAPKDFNLGHI
jgi:uncharacterized protein (TIGR02231 family)